MIWRSVEVQLTLSSHGGKGVEKRLMRPLLWSILAAAMICGCSVIVSDLHAVSESSHKLRLVGWVVVLGPSVANYGLRFGRWEIYLRRLGVRVPSMRSLAYYLGGFAFTTTPGKAGEAVRSLYLRRHGVDCVHSLTAFFAERFVDLVAMVLLALVAAMTFSDFQWPVLLATALVTGLLLLVHVRHLHEFVDRQTQRLPLARLRTIALQIADLLRSSSTLLRSVPLYAGVMLALIAWGAEGWAFHVILHKLDIDTSLGLAVGIYSVSILAGAATLICRLATLWFGVIIGGCVLAAIEVNTKIARRPASSV